MKIVRSCDADGYLVRNPDHLRFFAGDRRRGDFSLNVTNERSGDLSVIDSETHSVVATVPLGKRPRGIHASPDGKLIYVALSGSPISSSPTMCTS
mgnify:CR=1 FL=1